MKIQKRSLNWEEIVDPNSWESHLILDYVRLRSMHWLFGSTQYQGKEWKNTRKGKYELFCLVLYSINDYLCFVFRWTKKEKKTLNGAGPGTCRESMREPGFSNLTMTRQSPEPEIKSAQAFTKITHSGYKKKKKTNNKYKKKKCFKILLRADFTPPFTPT